MSTLVETYSRTTGLRIGKMELYEEFIPLPNCEKYIVVVSGSGMGGKNYSYFNEALEMVAPQLHKAGYKIVQLGEEKDEKLPVDINLCGQTTINQYFYLIKNCELVLSGDTSAIHLAGHYNKYVVALFGLTSPKISGAYYGDKSKQSYLVPPNHKPTFNPNERPKLVDKIPPEQAAQEVGRFLGFEVEKRKTISIGEKYKNHILEIIPDHVVPASFAPNQILNLRYDYGGLDDFVYKNVAQRKCTIVTDKALNVNILAALRNNIQSVIYNIDSTNDIVFIKALIKAAIPYVLLSYKTNEELNPLKLDYLDFNPINRREQKTAADFYGVNADTLVKTNKILISKARVFTSLAHYKRDIDANQENGKNLIDSPDFWRDVEFFYLFQKFID